MFLLEYVTGANKLELKKTQVADASWLLNGLLSLVLRPASPTGCERTGERGRWLRTKFELQEYLELELGHKPAGDRLREYDGGGGNEEDGGDSR